MTLLKWKKNDDVFPSVLSDWFDDFGKLDVPRFPVFNNKPSVNIKETNESYLLEVAVPGFKKDDFNIDVDKNVLTISGNKETKSEKEDEGYTKREFNYTSFSRSFTLPETVNVDDISGSYDDGILNITLPKKAEAATPKKSIKVS